MNSPKPMAANASTAMCTVRTCLSRENADSTDMGVGRVSITWPSTSFISY